ncbi:MAG: hypothetical protein R3A50_09345 [Saprospiraceae bacterium]|nr:hypothetical protein [Saprospiraceae bacterium]MCB9344619.1 hypothetical protein [Lewinellaceae bacterium]
MTNRILLTIFLLSLFSASSAQTASRTFAKSFNTENLGNIAVDLPGDIEFKAWENSYIKIEIGITIASNNGAILNELANVGRYNLVAKSEGDKLVITAPNLQKQIRIKGEELHEEFTYTVFVPKDLNIELPQVTAATELKK